MPDPPLSIEILAFPETTLILLAAIIEPLRATNRIMGQTLYTWKLASLNGEPIRTTAQISVPIDGRFVGGSSEDPLFVVSSYNWQRYDTSQARSALAKAARQRSSIAGVESGTWLMAAAGLLDHHKATIHWEDRDLFASSFPNIEIVTDRYVFDRKRMTTGGALPTLDMMLEIVRRRQGHAIALEVARSFVYERDSGVRELLPPSTTAFGVLDPRLSRAIKLMEETTSDPLKIDDVARHVEITARHLQSLFQGALGVSPQEHYLALRLNAARRRVIETKIDLEGIAEMAGFSSPSAFSRAYRAQFAESPSETRRRLRPR